MTSNAPATPSVFNFNNHPISAITNERGEPLFLANEVCAILGYKNPRMSVERHCREDGVTKRDIIDSMGRTQEATYINEGNLYRLIVKSRKPEAEAFEALVMEEILPSIRKTGKYEAQPQPQNEHHIPLEHLIEGGLTKEQFTALCLLVQQYCKNYDKKEMAQIQAACSRKLKSQFKVARVEYIPTESFNEAISIIANLFVDTPPNHIPNTTLTFQILADWYRSTDLDTEKLPPELRELFEKKLASLTQEFNEVARVSLKRYIAQTSVHGTGAERKLNIRTANHVLSIATLDSVLSARFRIGLYRVLRDAENFINSFMKVMEQTVYMG